VLDFVHRMETRDGTKASLRQVGILLAEICGLELPAETPARKGASGQMQTEGTALPGAADAGRTRIRA
jgi:hypothetical protein